MYSSIQDDGCPEEYDSSTDYDAGDSVFVRSQDGRSVMYECKKFPYNGYCNTYKPGTPNSSMGWAYKGGCTGTFAPTSSPTFDLDDISGPGSGCPEEYDSITDYKAGDKVTVKGAGETYGKIYQCNSWPYSAQCGMTGYEPGLLGGQIVNGRPVWKDAWTYVGGCTGSNSPTASPTFDLDDISGCPDEYYYGIEYEEGDEVSVKGVDETYGKVYRCRPWPYSGRCAMVGFKPGTPNSSDWKGAWAYVGGCAGTNTPTVSPTFDVDDITGCPNEYESGILYEAGDKITVKGAGETYGKVYQCRTWPQTDFCNIEAYKPRPDGQVVNKIPIWKKAWTYVGGCTGTITPTAAPIFSSLSQWELGGCPPEYVPDNSNYFAGDYVSVSKNADNTYGVVWQCKTRTYPWCRLKGYAPGTQNGRNAWEKVGVCVGTMAPTRSPTAYTSPCQFKKQLTTTTNGEYVVVQAESWKKNGVAMATVSGGVPFTLYKSGDLVRYGSEAYKCNRYPFDGFCNDFSPFIQDSSDYNPNHSPKGWSKVTCENIATFVDDMLSLDAFDSTNGGPIFASNDVVLVGVDGTCQAWDEDSSIYVPSNAINPDDYFKSSPSVKGCQKCADTHGFENNLSGQNPDVCNECEVGTTSMIVDGKSQCVCNNGASDPWSGDSSQCESCPRGKKYLGVIGDSAGEGVCVDSCPSSHSIYSALLDDDGENYKVCCKIPGCANGRSDCYDGGATSGGDPVCNRLLVSVNVVLSTVPSNIQVVSTTSATDRTSESDLQVIPIITTEPSVDPSNVPSSVPSYMPSDNPSSIPSHYPSGIPSFVPSLEFEPSSFPSSYPSSEPSSVPSFGPAEYTDIDNLELGTARHSAGIWTVDSSGRDIWETADSFRYVNFTVTGDVIIEIRVDSFVGDPDHGDYIHPWAKGGLMIRDTLDASSRHFSLYVTGSEGVANQWRDSQGAYSGHIKTRDSYPSPVWLQLKKAGDVFTAAFKIDQDTEWTSCGVRKVMDFGDNFFVGIAVSSHFWERIVTLHSADFRIISFDSSQEPTLGSDLYTDINNLQLGTVVRSSDETSWKVDSSGVDIWETSDSFRYVNFTVTGDVIVEMKVGSFVGDPLFDDYIHPWAKGGLMIRDTLNESSRHFSLFVTGSEGVANQWRDSQGAYSGHISTHDDEPMPVWLQLKKSGNMFSAFFKSDESNAEWIPCGVRKFMDFGSEFVAGIAVSSHFWGRVATLHSTDFRISSFDPLPDPSMNSHLYTDINNLLIMGTVDQPSAGSWAVTSSGTGISGNKDSFRYVNITARGNAIIEMKVNSFVGDPLYDDYIHPWAKGGLMIRDTLDAGSRHFSLFVTGENGLANQWRETQDGYSGHKQTHEDDPRPVWLQVQKVGHIFSAFFKSNERDAEWIPFGVRKFMDFGDEFVVGIAVTSHWRDRVVTLHSTDFSMTSFDPSSEPSSDLYTDINNLLIMGTVDQPSAGSWAVTSSGTDIWETADSFRYVTFTETGDVIVEMKVNSFVGDPLYDDYIHPWAKGGLMIRDTLDAGSRHFSLYSTGSEGIANQWRESQGAYSGHSKTSEDDPRPVWLQLKKIGGTFTAAFKTDEHDAEWISYGVTKTMDFGDEFFVGIAVSSHYLDRTVTLHSTDFSISDPQSLITITSSPSNLPSSVPSFYPSTTPSNLPSSVPSLNPSMAPSNDPSNVPSDLPSLEPSIAFDLANLGEFIDINNSVMGSAVQSSDGSWAITGTGHNIWGVSDGFGFFHTTATGDATIEMKVNSFVGDPDHSNFIDSWAHGGLMIRDNLDKSSRHFSIFVTGNNGIANKWRDCTCENGCESGNSNNRNVDPRPVWLQLQKVGHTFSASYKVDESDAWTPFGDTKTMDFGPEFLIGIAVNSHDSVRVATLHSTDITVSPFQLSSGPSFDSGLTIPGDFTNIGSVDADMGTVVKSSDGSSWAVSSPGMRLWGPADGFRFVNFAATGDVTVEMRVTAFVGDPDHNEFIDSWAKGGLMIRDTLDDGSRHFSMLVTGDNGLANQWRDSQDGNSGISETRDDNPRPVWLQVKKVGNAFSAAFKYDEEILGPTCGWIPFGVSQTMDFGSEFVVGIAVSSHDIGKVVTLHSTDFRIS